MISKRFKNDGIASKKLNSLQLSMRDQVEEKVQNGTYQLETIDCVICGNQAFEELAGKDRYGLTLNVVICPNCGLVLTNPRMNEEAYAQFYNIEYRKLYVATEEATQQFFDKQYNKGKRIINFMQTHQLLDFSSELFILEVGCGAGGILKAFQELGCQVKGIDIGEEYVQFGREHYDLDLEVAFLKDIELEKTPNLVIYADVMEHILHPIEELKSLKSVIDDHTLVYVSMPGIQAIPESISYRMDFMQLLQNAHVWHFTLTSLSNLMGKENFACVVGTEDIESAFRLQSVGTLHWKTDYENARGTLYRLERYRLFYHLKYYLRRVSRKIKHITGYNR